MVASQTEYLDRSAERRPLRFSDDGDAVRERLYRTHWISGALPERKREAVAKKASKAPELVVISALNDAWRCHRCGDGGELLMMEPPGPACLRCTGLGDLEFLGAGDAL